MNIRTFETLREIVARDYATAPESLTPDTTLADLAIDSLALIELIFTLEDRFHVVAGDAAVELATLSDVADYIDRLVADRERATGTESSP